MWNLISPEADNLEKEKTKDRVSYIIRQLREQIST